MGGIRRSRGHGWNLVARGSKRRHLTTRRRNSPGRPFEGLNIAVACRGEAYQGRIDPSLNNAIKTR